MMRWLRGGVWVLIVACLLYGVYKVGALQGDVEDQTQTTGTVEDILARACGAASLDELHKQGLVAECRLAKADDLAENIPENAPEPDPIPDDTTADDATIAAAVADYFEANPLPDPQYRQRIEAAVTEYLRANPPPPGPKPTPAEVQAAARAVLLANPPDDGRGVATATLSGCTITFTFTDGTTDRVGPVCGPPGAPGPPAPPPTPADLRAAVDAFCAANGDCRGPAGPSGVVTAEDACNPPPGEVVTDVNVAYEAASQTLRLTCATILPGGGPGSG